MPRTLVRLFRKRIFIFVSAFLVLAIAAPAQVRDRILQNIGDTEPAVVSAPHPLARAEFDQGRVEGSMPIHHASMMFSLAPQQQSALNKLLAEQQDPHSSNYRKWLTPEQYAARFGMSDSDLAKVSVWLKSQGLTVDGYSRARTSVFFSGSAAQVEGAFHTQFDRYLVNGEIHFANSLEIHVPAALSSTVLGFRGLDDFRPSPRVHLPKPEFTSHVTGNHFVAPGDFATIYDVQPLYDTGLDGTGVSIAVVGQSLIAANNATTDLDAFRAAAGLSTKDPTFVLVPGTGTATIRSAGDQTESLLVLEWSGAVAKNADIIFVYTGTSGGAFDAINFAIDQNLAPIISSSYGICEPQFGTGLAGFRVTMQQGNSQGQTIIGPAGDSGAADCESSSATVAVLGLAVDVPASIPEVTAVGGSEFNATLDGAGAVTGTAPNTVAGATAFWSGSNGTADTISSALSYIPEVAWNDTAANSTLSATGGGVSANFTKPSWQIALTPADGQRDVPDIALNASPNHDPTMICAQGSCVNGFRDASGNLDVVGGTSVGAPTFAGIVAILNQATAKAGLGNINPTLYTLAASTPTAFHDITTGNNIVPCTPGTPTTGPAAAKCPSSGPAQFGYSAGTGYDLVTGLGSLDANVLVTSWPGFVVTPSFSVGVTAATVTAPGDAGTSTITVKGTNGFSGAVDLTCTPPTTTTTITCSFGSTTPVTLSSTTTSATATLTISTTAPHVVSGQSASLGPRGLGWLPASGGTLLAGILFLGVPSRRRRRIAGLGLTLLVFFAAGMGCGGGSSSSAPKTGGTPAGSYSITVTATSGSISQTSSAAVTVQ
jgi:subtilase family serine protease